MELRIPPLLLLVVFSGLAWLLALVLPAASFMLPGAGWLAALLLTLGLAFVLAGVLAFRNANTTVDPRVPHATSSLVVRGIYRFSRNPMYVGFLCVLAAWTMFLGNMPAMLLLPVFVLYLNRFQIKPEERFMREKFGQQFEQYCGQVRRWI